MISPQPPFNAAFCPAPSHPTSCLISLEGLEGAGKTTQSQKLQQLLTARGREVTLLREPGGTAFGEHLRHSILHSPTPLEPIAEAYLFASSRAQLLREHLLPQLAKPHQAVIVDRYYDSSVAYQGFGLELGAETIEAIHHTYPLHYLPHITFYLDIPLAMSSSRLQVRGKKKDYFESLSPAFFARVAKGFNWCAKHYPQRVIRIPGDDSAHTIAEKIAHTLQQKNHV